MPHDKVLTKPCILLFASNYTGIGQQLRELQAGMEEEGIPCQTVFQPEGAAAILGFLGAQQSQLGVGVGVAPDGLCIHYYKLPAERPLYVMQGGGPADWRRFGYNAARLIKGIPFKAEQQPEPVEPDTELIEQIRQIIYRVLQEQFNAPKEVRV